MRFYCVDCGKFYDNREDVSVKWDDGKRIAWVCKNCLTVGNEEVSRNA